LFEHVKAIPPDPILGVLAAYQADSNPNKIDLGVGVYRDEHGATPILECVRTAEKRFLENQTTKTYLGPRGVPGFNTATTELIFGAGHEVITSGRARTIQTPGGTGALRVGADLIYAASTGAAVWASQPTWANHLALFPAAGLAMHSYPYYDPETNRLRFDEMIEALRQRGPGDVVLLHACCHNPSGVSPDPDQWQTIAQVAGERGFLPYIDLAYLGFERGLEEDALSIRALAEHCPEMLIASSCSKNFAMYRDRVGALTVVARDAVKAADIETVINSLTRKNYSMPPAHGPAVIDIILHDDALKALWVSEVAAMRNRINGLRGELVERIRSAGIDRDFSFLDSQSGMFSFLGLTPEQVQRLSREFSIYTVSSARINIASLNAGNLDYFVDALKVVIEA